MYHAANSQHSAPSRPTNRPFRVSSWLTGSRRLLENFVITYKMLHCILTKKNPQRRTKCMYEHRGRLGSGLELEAAPHGCARQPISLRATPKGGREELAKSARDRYVHTYVRNCGSAMT